MYRIFFLALLFPFISNSQKIEWENYHTYSNFWVTQEFFTKVDYNNDIYITIDGSTTHITPFLKFNKHGNTAFYKNINLGHVFFPYYISKNDNGYEIFGFGSDDFLFTSKTYRYVPIIVKTDKNGDIKDTIYPYNISNYDKRALYTMKLSHNYTHARNSVVKLNDTYCIGYAGSISEPYVFDTFTINAYNTDGEYKWTIRDTANGSGDKYYASQMLISEDNNVLAMYRIYEKFHDKLSTIIIKADYQGNELKRIEYTPYEGNIAIHSRYFRELLNGNYLILGNSTESNYEWILTEINNEGETVNQVFIENSNVDFVDFSGFKITPEGNIMLYGQSIDDYDNTGDITKITNSLYLLNLNNNYEKNWDFRWNTINSEGSSTRAQAVRDIHYLTEDSIYAIGFKNEKDVFCSKISLTTLSVNNYESKLFFTISPNPASDYIEISFGSYSVNNGLQPIVHGGEFEIYDLLGNEVYSTKDNALRQAQQPRSRSAGVDNDGSFSGYFDVSTTLNDLYAQQPLRIDVSHLPRGVYFVRLGNKVEKFVKK